MKVVGSNTIRAERTRVWRLLTSPEVLRRCVPGCESLEEDEDGSYKIGLKAGVGTIKGKFNGSIRLEDINEPENYTMIVDGKGAPGFIKGIGTLNLLSQENETEISYMGDVSVGGTIAGVGQRMILSTAKLMISQFFTAIQAEIDAIEKSEASNEPFKPPKQGFIRNTIRQIKK